MAKTGRETSHIMEGLTLRDADIDRLSVGANGQLTQFNLPNIFSSQLTPTIGLMTNITTVYTANDARGVRAIVPRDGNIVEVVVYQGATVAGNIDCGIYDVAATTRNRLWSNGAIAAAGANSWTSFTTGLPLAVLRGQAIDLVVGMSNATNTLGGGTALGNTAVAQLPSASWNPTFNDAFTQATAGVNTGKLSWSIATQMPLPATLTEASLVAATTVTFIMCRMA